MNENLEAAQTGLVAKYLPVSAADKADWAKRFAESGLSLRKFSAQHRLCYMSLWRWVNKSREAASAASPIASFTEIKLPALAQGTNWSAELSFANGKVLRL